MPTPKTGTQHEQPFVVEAAHTIKLAGDDLPPVLATPWLIWHLEHAGLELLRPNLGAGEISVGTHVDIEHLAPALVGEECTATARVVHTEGRSVTLRVEARGPRGQLARGLHKRRIVRIDRLREKLQQPDAG